MIIIPAIDLLGNKVVRLEKGKKESAIVYSKNPLSVAKQWVDYGAKIIHIVDLDAAFGEGSNINIIEKIVSCGIDVQLGGGIRTLDKARGLINLGIKRLVIGSNATNKEFIATVIQEFGDKIAAGVDVLKGKFMKLGWQKDSGYKAMDFIAYLINNGIKWIIYTDINRDGTLKGVNIKTVKELKRFNNLNFIISGGISSLDDIKRIKTEAPFVKGVIIGKVLYENRINLKEAFRIS